MKGMIIVHDIDDEIEIDGYEYWASLHDTDIYVPSRDDNCRLTDRQLFVLILFGLIGSGIIGQLIERSDLRLLRHFRAQPPLRLLRHLRVQPFSFCNGKQNWGSLSGDCQRGKFAPSLWRGAQCQII